MPEVITFGETMAVVTPKERGRLREVDSFSLTIAGAESNTAIGLSRLGHSVGWISSLGDDELGRLIKEKINIEGVDTSTVKIDQKHRTGLMFKEFNGDETTVYYYRENSAASHYQPDMLPWEYISDAKIIHLTGITPLLSEGGYETVKSLYEYAKKSGKIISFDPNLRPKLWGDSDPREMIRELLFSSDIALIGINEAKLLFGISEPEKIIKQISNRGVNYIALKDGARGAWCYHGGETVFIPPYPCNPVDPVGAGDGFGAGFLAGILEGKTILECGKMGGVVGAMATETTGDVDGYPTREKLNERLV